MAIRHKTTMDISTQVSLKKCVCNLKENYIKFRKNFVKMSIGYLNEIRYPKQTEDSLGMVGALSIVRFRTAIKDPMDLLYLFWAITTGITAGAGMYVLALLAAAIMILMIVLFYHKQQRGKIYIAVIHYTGDQAGDEVIRCFGKRKYFVKSKTMRKEKTEMAVELYCRQNDMDFMEKIRSIEDVEDVTLIQYNGEYHG